MRLLLTTKKCWNEMDFLKSSLTHPQKKKQNYTPIMEAIGSRVLSDDAHEAAIDLKKLEI